MNQAFGLLLVASALVLGSCQKAISSDPQIRPQETAPLADPDPNGGTGVSPVQATSRQTTENTSPSQPNSQHRRDAYATTAQNHTQEDWGSLRGTKLSIQVTADWNDIDAALDVGLVRGQSAIVQTTRQPRHVTFTLTSITGRHGQITFARQSDAAGPQAPSEPIVIQALIEGSQGPTLAQRLLEATAARLNQLAGVATAPTQASDLAPEPMHDTR